MPTSTPADHTLGGPGRSWSGTVDYGPGPLHTPTGLEELRALITGKVVALSGNSGVGKSSVLNRLAPELHLPTGEVSEKLGRGRHTTREVVHNS